MARNTLTRNLRLRLSSDLSADSTYNLLRLDQLAGTFLPDADGNSVVRSTGDITIQPQSSDVGGTGTGGLVNLGTPDQPLTSLVINADSVSFSSGFGLSDTAAGGDKSLALVYKSDINGSVDTVANRTLSIDLDGADRSLVLGANLTLTGSSLALTTTGATSVTLPLSGTLSTLAGTETLTNKTLAAGSNTITGLADANIASGAGISGTKVLASFGNQYVESTVGLRLTNGSYSTTISQAQSGQAADITLFLPSSDGTPGQVLTTDGSGALGWSNSSSASLSGLTDVSLGVPVGGDFLRFDGGTELWVSGKPYTSVAWLAADGATKAVVHGLDAPAVIVQVFDESNQLVEVGTVDVTDNNTVTLTASQAPDVSWTVNIYTLV